MNSIESKTRIYKRQLQSFILKCALAQFLIAMLFYCGFNEYFRTTVNNNALGTTLLVSAFWNTAGITFYLFYNNSNRIAKDVEKILILVLFFAPTTSIMIFGPMLSGEVIFCEFPKLVMNQNTGNVPIFFARCEISPGESFTNRNIIVLSGDHVRLNDSIEATKDNHFGKPGNINSILMRKATVSIDAGSHIKNSDITPRYW
jgi:hypothetical protein